MASSVRGLAVVIVVAAVGSHVAQAVNHGPKVRPGEWPAVVALVDRGTHGAGFLGSDLAGVFCTGTLIRPRIVLTASHCVTLPLYEKVRDDLATQVSVYRGEGRLNYLGAVSGQASIRRAIIHPQSVDGIDLALVLLEAPLDGVAPIAIADAPLGSTADVVSVGFGQARPEDDKRNTMGQKSSAARRVDFSDDKEICSRRARVKTPSSGGDSGGPALRRVAADRYEVIGAMAGYRTKTSNGKTFEADCWIPVAPHLDWLNRAIAELERDADTSR